MGTVNLGFREIDNPASNAVVYQRIFLPRTSQGNAAFEAYMSPSPTLFQLDRLIHRISYRLGYGEFDFNEVNVRSYPAVNGTVLIPGVQPDFSDDAETDDQSWSRQVDTVRPAVDLNINNLIAIPLGQLLRDLTFTATYWPGLYPTPPLAPFRSAAFENLVNVTINWELLDIDGKPVRCTDNRLELAWAPRTAMSPGAYPSLSLLSHRGIVVYDGEVPPSL